VRNEPDGSVCAELQGTPDQIARVLEHFGRHRPGRVDSEDVMDVQPEPALPDAGFIVAR
jgi:acylphosphatase